MSLQECIKRPQENSLNFFKNHCLRLLPKKIKAPTNWLDAFYQLKDYCETLTGKGKKVLFIDELRWLVQEMGLERLVIKSGKLVGYFISNPQSPFFETETFTTLLNRIITIGQVYRLVQQNEKLRLVIEPVKHIKDAFEKLGVLVR